VVLGFHRLEDLVDRRDRRKLARLGEQLLDLVFDAHRLAARATV